MRTLAGQALACILATVACQTLLSILWSLRPGDGQNRGAVPMPRRDWPPQPSGPAVLSARLRVDQVVLHRLRPSPCVTLDWWPADKCDYGDCPWANASLLTADLDNPLLRTVVRALSPLTLRVGGSLADQVTYAGIPNARPAVSPRSCASVAPFTRDETRRIGFRGGCLPWERWLGAHKFCQKEGCHLFFSVNALRGRSRERCPDGTLCRRLPRGARPGCCTNYTGDWDSRNLRALLRATAAAGHRPAGLAFGNEIAGEHGIEAHLPPLQYARELRAFGALVRTVWPEKPPLLLAPDSNSLDASWLAAWLDELWKDLPPAAPPSPAADGSAAKRAADGAPPARQPLDYVSHHMYPLSAGGESGGALLGKLLDPKHLEQSAERLRGMARAVRNHSKGNAKLCVSETGGAYNSGARGLTDAYASGFWWLPLLGALGQHSHDFACRQALIGGRYALLDLERGEPSPDFYATLLWRRLMSPKALRASKWGMGRPGAPAGAAGMAGTADLAAASPPPPANATGASGRKLRFLRAYAHCARAAASAEGLNSEGGIVVLAINLSPVTTHHVHVDLPGTPADEANVTARVDFVLTAPAARRQPGEPADGQAAGGAEFPADVDLASRTVLLNGLPLAMSDGELPAMAGEPSVGQLIELPPLSFGFFAFPSARNSACMTPEQLVEQRRAEKRADEERKKKRKKAREKEREKRLAQQGQ